MVTMLAMPAQKAILKSAACEEIFECLLNIRRQAAALLGQVSNELWVVLYYCPLIFLIVIFSERTCYKASGAERLVEDTLKEQ